MQWQQKSFHSTLACITATNTLHSVIFALCCVLHVLQSYTVVMLHSILLIISLDTRINACAHKANTFTNICMYIYVKKYISTSMYILYKCLYVFSPEYVMFLARRWQSSLQLIHCEHHSLNLPAGVKRKKHVQLLSHHMRCYFPISRPPHHSQFIAIILFPPLPLNWHFACESPRGHVCVYVARYVANSVWRASEIHSS